MCVPAKATGPDRPPLTFWWPSRPRMQTDVSFPGEKRNIPSTILWMVCSFPRAKTFREHVSCLLLAWKFSQLPGAAWIGLPNVNEPHSFLI